jgi:predicted hydrolase (HD superfamily)
MEKTLFAADPVTGLIVAAALMHPEKKIASLDLDFLKRRFKEKRFAAGADREQISKCSELGMELDEFLELSLEGMRDVAEDIGL